MEAREGYKKTKLGCLPIGWEVRKLSETATYRRGSFPQPYGLDEWYDEENGHPFVQVFDIGDNMRLKDDTKRRISDAAAEKSVFVEKGTLLLTLQGSIGRIAITHYDAYVDRTLLIFRTFLTPTDIRFFMYVVHRLFDIEKRNAPGSTIKTITKASLSGFLVPFPPLPEQQKIAGILTTVDDKIASIENRLQQTEQLKKGLMKKLLAKGIGHTEFKDTKIGRIPASWQHKTLNEVSYGTQNGLYKDKSHYGSGYEMVHMPDVFANEQIIECGMKKVSVSDTEKEKYELFEGDLVFARRSLVPEGSGKCCYVGRINSCITFESSIIRVSLKKDNLHSKYAYYYISSPLGRKEMMKYVRQVAVSGISGKDLQKYNLPVPTIPEQKQIASILSTVDDKIDVLHTMKANYETLKKGLIEQLLTGEMRVKL